MTVRTVHTIDARGNILLELVRKEFNVSSAEMLREIQAIRRTVEEILRRKGVEYASLRSALVPSQKRRECAFVFDKLSIENDWYGRVVFEHLIPLLDPKSNHSILAGDYLGDNHNQLQRYKAMVASVRFKREIQFRYSSQFYVVYINNLTAAMVRQLDDGLAHCPGYVGLADTTFGSAFELLLSTMLPQLCIKHGRTIIQGHEDDLSEDDDVNMCGFPFEESGYTCRSVPSYLEGVLLSYKIERPVFGDFEVDTELSLNAVSDSPLPLDSFVVEVEDAKLAYIKSEKSASMLRAGLEHMSSGELGGLIANKINANYIYSLSADANYGVTKFNVILEVAVAGREPTRLLAALEYRAAKRALRLITLF